jgi:hypothetical protein
MRATLAAGLLAFVPLLALAPLACGADPTVGGTARAAVDDDDPLALGEELEPGTLDELHARVIQPGCAGQPGLCHSGQFEPNLSTPALSYLNLSRRPSLERTKQLRVAPGESGNSLLVDKLRNHQVISQMPLGAAPLAEADIQAIEAWIDGGALRRPGEPEVPILNNPPAPPVFALFDAAGVRLDATGPATVAVGATVTFRQAVEDFEVADANMPFVVVVASLADGRNVLFSPELADGAETAICAYDAAGPTLGGDVLAWKYDFTIPDTLDLLDPASGLRTQLPAAGQTLSVIAAYVDGDLSKGGYLTYAILPNWLVIP